MNIDLTFYDKCISVLGMARGRLSSMRADGEEYDVYRSACIKEFEIILE